MKFQDEMANHKVLKNFRSSPYKNISISFLTFQASENAFSSYKNSKKLIFEQSIQ
jgi:hypothetical protein